VTDAEKHFAETGAYREGHFQLKSGRHGDRYIEKFQVLQWPERVEQLCQSLAEFGRDAQGAPNVDVVVGPTTGGVILAYEVARQLGVRGFFAEQTTGADGTQRREFRRGFAIEPGERVLLVDDVLTTGASLLEMVPLIESTGGELVAAAVIVDRRSGGGGGVTSPTTGREYRLEALWAVDLPTFEAGAATCPGCAAGLPLETPGASGTKPGGSKGSGSK
jgi:orotate phosphoribosyltransferase